MQKGTTYLVKSTVNISQCTKNVYKTQLTLVGGALYGGHFLNDPYQPKKPTRTTLLWSKNICMTSILTPKLRMKNQ